MPKPFRIILVLLSLLLGGCVANQGQDGQPDGRPLPLYKTVRVKSVLQAAFDPATEPFLSKIKWQEVDDIHYPSYMPNEQNRRLGGFYNFSSNTVWLWKGMPEECMDDIIVHETLHSFWQYKRIANQEEFEASMQSCLLNREERYQPFVRVLTSLFVRICRNYASEDITNEICAVFGSRLVFDKQFLLCPEVILRHYRGVLAPEIIARRSG